MKQETLDMLAEDAQQLDGLDNALIGASTQGYLVYSYSKIVAEFINQGMSEEEAVEYTDYNVVGLDGNGNWTIVYDNWYDTFCS